MSQPGTALIEKQPTTIKNDTRQQIRRWGLIAAAAAIFLLAVVFHSIHLANSPGWDADEGYNLDIAWNLLHGHLRMFALTSAFVQHPPLFYLLLAGAIRLFGYSILTLRVLAVFFSLATTALLLTLGRRMLGAGPSLWGALVFTAAPLALNNTRWGYTYSLLMLVAFLGVYACWRYLSTASRRWLLLAACLGALAILSDYEGAFLVVFLILVTLRVRPRHCWLAAGIGFGVPLLLVMGLLLITPATFFSDLAFTAGRAAGGNPIVQVLNIIINFQRLLSLDSWVLLGFVGLWLVRDARLRGFLLAAFALLLIFILKVRDLNPYFHSGVPLLPWLALGAGVALDRGITTLFAWLNGWWDNLLPQTANGPRWLRLLKRQSIALTLFLVIISPLGITIALDAVGLATRLRTNIETTLATNSDDAQRAIAYVLGHAQPGDLVLASPQLAWALDNPEDTTSQGSGLLAADPLQSIAYSGQDVAFYPANLTPSRFAFDPSLARTRYAIVDNLWRTLAAPDQVPQMQPLLAQVQQWTQVAQFGEYTIYEQSL
ncbi:MAG TPA: glycosyltransferase family 39 protein [Ktedonobacterales bacterium]